MNPGDAERIYAAVFAPRRARLKERVVGAVARFLDDFKRSAARQDAVQEARDRVRRDRGLDAAGDDEC